MSVLLEKFEGALEGAVAVGAQVLTVERDLFVGREARAFEACAQGCLVIHLADIEFAAVRQRVAASDGEHAAAGGLPDDVGAASFLERRDEDFRRARSSFRSKDDD